MSTRLNRRHFLKSTTAAATLTLASRRSKAADRPAPGLPPPRRGPNDEIRTAIVGIRSQGQFHIKLHVTVKGVRVVTLCDPDENLFADRIKLVGERPPRTVYDLRRVMDDKDVDCAVVTTPNHWHSLAAIWACQAGKDVYVEKPVSHNIFEGRKLVEAAAKYNRVVQVGTQVRANQGRQQAMKLLREGVIGDVYMVRAFVYRVRKPIGTHPNEANAPAGVHYDLWLGPAPVRPFNKNRFHYEWHWNWDYGGGETGNNGPHLTDLAIEGLNKQEEFPVRIFSMGGRFAYHDQGVTPNMQVVNYVYADGSLFVLEVRNLSSNEELGGREAAIFFGTKGHLTLTAGKYETMVDGQPGPKGDGAGKHLELIQNFYDVVRSRKMSDLLAPVKYGHTGAGLCHLGNISYRLGRSLEFDPRTETFPRDPEANALLTRDYRKPYVVPETV